MTVSRLDPLVEKNLVRSRLNSNFFNKRPSRLIRSINMKKQMVQIIKLLRSVNRQFNFTNANNRRPHVT